MKTYFVQLLIWAGLLTVLSGCRSKAPEAVGAIIETAIPNGLVPGSALTLKGRDFGTVQSVKFANTTVAVGSFIRTATGEVTLKVPIGTQAGEVRVVGEKGPGQPKQMALLTGGGPGPTLDNVSTNVNTVTQGYFFDNCNPEFMLYCYKGACIGYLHHNRNTDQASCVNEKFYTVETIGGAQYEVYKPYRINYQQVILKFEKRSAGSGYTGLILIQTPDGNTYAGSVLKDGNLAGYSLNDNSVLKLCKPNPFVVPNGRGSLCEGNGCSTCQ